MRSSTELIVMSRRTRTSLVWPILCALSCACRSWWGFQSESKIMTVSAVWRFSPRPPALVERRNMKYSEPLQLNSFSMSPLSSALVMPSSLRNL